MNVRVCVEETPALRTHPRAQTQWDLINAPARPDIWETGTIVTVRSIPIHTALFSAAELLSLNEDCDECGGECGGNACPAGISTCHNTEGSYSCTCDQGYTGPGLVCHGETIPSVPL